MPLNIIDSDIRLINTDAIVCPTDNYLTGNSGVSKLIFNSAGNRLKEKCKEIGFLKTGDAVLTEGYDLVNSNNIIHFCLPTYIDGNYNEEELYKDCYLKALKIADSNSFESIAIPLETNNFPKGLAYKLAKRVISEFIKDNELNVYLVVSDKEEIETTNNLFETVGRIFKEKRVESPKYAFGNKVHFKGELKEAKRLYDELNTLEMCSISADYALPLAENEFEPDESFSEALVRMIDERDLKDPDVYHKANIDRKLFNHIINDVNYRPRKETAIALCIGLGLDKEETNDLLEKAGFILSKSSVFDKIITYCLENNIYDIYEINELLFSYDQKTLGN